MLHFNACSIVRKFDEIKHELTILDTDVIFITETWLSPHSSHSLYGLSGYSAFHNYRLDKTGGGASVYVRNNLFAVPFSDNVTPNGTFNICAVTFGQGLGKTLLLAVYKAPWASANDVESMCDVIDSLVSLFSRVVMAGDFNFPGMNWLNVRATADSVDERFLQHHITEHSLSQIVTQPTRERAILDLVFLSDTLRADDVEHLPPNAGSDHDAQLWYVTLPALQRRRNLRRYVDYAKLNCALSLIGWTAAFKGCAVTDDYAARFTNLVLDAANKCSAFVPLFRRPRLPKHIVVLLRVKKRAWTSYMRTRDMSAFKAASRTVRAALRQHRRCEEMRLIYSQDRHRLFKYINCKTGAGTKSIHVCKNDVALTDQEAAEVLLQTFSSNFSIRHTAKPSSTSIHTQSLTDFACTPALIVEALHRCPNSNSCPDGLSFKLIKAVAKSIIAPLTIIFQHSLFEGIFPSVWKEAVVIPLYKGKGPKNSPHSYRPISLCQCFGKILERVV